MKNRRMATNKQTSTQLRRRKRLQYTANRQELARRVPIEGWDNKLTLRQNYRNIGIATDANNVVSGMRAIERGDTSNETQTEAWGTMTDRLVKYQALPKRAKYEAKSMSVQEQYRLQSLMKKHGDDYAAMARDIKLNIMQDTARQLEKRVLLMVKLQAAGAEDTDDEDAPAPAADAGSLTAEVEEEAITRALELIDTGKLEEAEFEKLFTELGSDEEGGDDIEGDSDADVAAGNMGDDSDDDDDDDEEEEEEEKKAVKPAADGASGRRAARAALVDAALTKAPKAGGRGASVEALKAAVLAERGLSAEDVARADSARRKVGRKLSLADEAQPLLTGVVGKKLKGRLQEMEGGAIVVKPRLVQYRGAPKAV